MAFIWTFLAIFIPLALTQRYMAGRPMMHGSVLLFGFAFYCTLPFAVYGFDLFQNGPGYDLWSREFEVAYKNSFLVLSFFFASWLFYSIGQLMPAPLIWTRFDGRLNLKFLRFSFVVLIAMWFLFVFQARDLLFSGYGEEYRPDLMGPLATVNLLVTLILLYMRQHTVLQWTWRAYLLLLALNSVALLSMGGRMYVMIALVCLFLQQINETAKQSLARLKLTILLLSGVFLLAAIGVWRLGMDFDWQILWITAIAEPILTSVSMSSYVGCSDLDWLSAPWNFIGSIINIVPTVFLPNKHDLLPQLDSSGSCLNSPFGATHIFAALLGNFGLLGSPFFLLFFSWFLKILKRNTGESRWIYYYVCGLLPFMFFRDGFLIFNKALIGQGLLSAFILVKLSRMRLR